MTENYNNIPIKPHLIFGTSAGSLGLIANVDDKTYSNYYYKLQRNMGNFNNVGTSHDDWRSGKENSDGAVNILDGVLIFN